MPSYLKNTKQTNDTWAGQQINASTYYLVPTAELSIFLADDKTITDIGSGDLVVSDVNDGTNDLGVAAGLALLEGSKPINIANPFPGNEGNYSFRGLGGSASLSTGSNNVDQVIPAIRFINGAEVWSDDPAYGNSITFQVVDVDNVLGYGAGTVIEEFGTTWQMHPGCITKAFPGYIASVPANLYVRMVVTVSQAASFHYNLHLHKQ